LLIKGAQVPVRGNTVLALDWRASRTSKQPATDLERLRAGFERLAANEAYGAPADQEALDNARIGGETFDTLFAKLERIAKRRLGAGAGGEPGDADEKKTQTEEDSRLFIALAATFRRHPDTGARARAKILAKSPARFVLIDALASSSSPAAQDVLYELMARKADDPDLRPSVLRALSRAPKPTAKSMDLLKSLLDDPESGPQALYGLGTYCRRLRDEGATERANRLGELLALRLDEVTTELEVIRALRAIANSGYDGVLPKVGPYLTDRRESVRAAAVRAVQSMADSEADDIIAAALEREPSPVVRVSAIDAAKVRTPNDVLVRALVSAATTAQDSHVRYRAVELISQWLVSRPELRATLDKISASDAERQIRERARAAL